jgi:DNA-binding CsgD family transcriptional regulator
MVAMTLNDSRLNILPSPPRFNNAVEKLNRLQTELISEALRRAADDAGAAMAHQLSEPLTALLLYLHEIKRGGECSGGTEILPASMRELIDIALHETIRVCGIVERVENSIEMPVDTEAAIARGCEAIDFWTRNDHVSLNSEPSSTPPLASRHPLTPREHEVLALITGGASNKEGSYRLGISTRTFEAHRAHLMGKLGAKNAADLFRIALSGS